MQLPIGRKSVKGMCVSAIRYPYTMCATEEGVQSTDQQPLFCKPRLLAIICTWYLWNVGVRLVWRLNQPYLSWSASPTKGMGAGGWVPGGKQWAHLPAGFHTTPTEAYRLHSLYIIHCLPGGRDAKCSKVWRSACFPLTRGGRPAAPLQAHHSNTGFLLVSLRFCARGLHMMITAQSLPLQQQLWISPI